MPNWVFTSMSVSGKEVDVRKFVEKAKQPHKTYWKDYKTDEVKEETDQRVISFWNFKKPENEQLYFGASDYKPAGYDELSLEEKMAISMTHSSDGWYDWNIRNWGTKWDTSDAEIYDADISKGSVSYTFSTAWSPAEGAFEAMVEQHPELSFEFRCEEEQGWGVVFEGQDGELNEVDSWDIPDNHEDSMKYLGRCNCEEYEDLDYLFEDCPTYGEIKAKEEKDTAKEVEKFDDISEMLV
jgi:hypothetical protein